MRFDWDNEKAERNRQKHGVTFGEAATVFGDFFAFTRPDIWHSVGEDREVTVGRSDRGRIITVISTDRQENGDVIRRIISARTATNQEINGYDDHIRRQTRGNNDGRRRGRRRRP